MSISQKQQNHFRKKGYIIGNHNDIGISQEDILQTAKLLSLEWDQISYGNPGYFHDHRKIWNGFLDDKQNSEFNETPIFQKAIKIFQGLGYSTHEIYFRASRLKLDKEHPIIMPTSAHDGNYTYTSLQTNIHRDYFSRRNRVIYGGNGYLVNLLMVFVLEQKGIQSSMKLIESDHEVISPFGTLEEARTKGIRGCKILQSVNGNVGTFYIINQRDFPKLCHHVAMAPTSTNSERIVLTFGIVERFKFRDKLLIGSLIGSVVFFGLKWLLSSKIKSNSDNK